MMSVDGAFGNLIPAAKADDVFHNRLKSETAFRELLVLCFPWPHLTSPVDYNVRHVLLDHIISGMSRIMTHQKDFVLCGRVRQTLKPTKMR
jgi:hypothetical protein